MSDQEQKQETTITPQPDAEKKKEELKEELKEEELKNVSGGTTNKSFVPPTPI
jgi:bacteriocin-like protein